MSTVELRPGCRLWLDGDAWSVVELSADLATIASGPRHRSVPLGVLVSTARLLDAGEQHDALDEPVNVALTSLTATQRSKLEDRARLVRSVLDDDDRPLRERLATTAEASGVSVRTLERWLTGYRTAGVAGLADSRVLNQRAVAIDPRWDAACLAVLREYVPASTPTMNVVIDRVRQSVEEEHGAGVVSCPPRTTAYRRLNELSKGRHAFGSGKARRSVAARPQGPYGRLRPNHPGEYAVLDTTPLDVFAMEPVTLR